MSFLKTMGNFATRALFSEGVRCGEMAVSNKLRDAIEKKSWSPFKKGAANFVGNFAIGQVGGFVDCVGRGAIDKVFIKKEEDK